MTEITACTARKIPNRAWRTMTMTQPLASHRPPAWAPGRTRPYFLPASRNRALCSSARRGSSRRLALHCDACLKSTRRACYPPPWSIQELTEVFSSIAHDCGDAATRESGTSGTAAASDADIEALASRTCASAARHSFAAAAAAALPFFTAWAATSVATSNSASILRFASNCFALFATLSRISRIFHHTIGQMGLCRLETVILSWSRHQCIVSFNNGLRLWIFGFALGGLAQPHWLPSVSGPQHQTLGAAASPHSNFSFLILARSWRSVFATHFSLSTSMLSSATLSFTARMLPKIFWSSASFATYSLAYANRSSFSSVFSFSSTPAVVLLAARRLPTTFHPRAPRPSLARTRAPLPCVMVNVPCAHLTNGDLGPKQFIWMIMVCCKCTQVGLKADRNRHWETSHGIRPCTVEIRLSCQFPGECAENSTSLRC